MRNIKFRYLDKESKQYELCLDCKHPFSRETGEILIRKLTVKYGHI